MAHSLRKYLSNRGSALFMVLSTMTALMITCMAMYFSVVSSRSTQYAVFNEQQSYQSALSINDTLLAGLKDGSLATGSKDLLTALSKMNEGDKMSTNGNGFASLSSTGTKTDEDQLGAYSTDITRLLDETVDGEVNMTFDIATTTSVNGVTDTVHTIVHIKKASKDKPPAPTQVFAATGYVPNDVFLDGGRFITDVFFDNEHTIVNAYGGKNMELWGNLSTGGSLTVHGYLIPSTTKPATFAIRNTYTANFNQPVKFAAGSEKSTVYIGGNCVLNNVNGFENANVYINGDLYVRGGANLTISNYFVNGNVYIENGYWINLSTTRCNGTVDASKNAGGGINAPIAGTWTSTATDLGFLTPGEALTQLDALTATNTYYKWTINSSDASKSDYIRELDDSVPGRATKKVINFTQNSENPIPTAYLNYSETEKGCIITDVVNDPGNTAYNNLTVVIDTGDDPDNIYTIRVKPNRDFDGDGVKESFSWYPDDYFNASRRVSVLVKGRGSVVIDVPEGVVYQDMSMTAFMHYNWFILKGGTVNTTTYPGKEIYNPAADSGSDDTNFARFVHTECGHAGDACTYETSSSTEKCSSCNGNKTAVTCPRHEFTTEYCPNCEPNRVDSINCKNRVDRQKIDEYLAANPGIAAKMEKDASGNLIYPTTNIFLISCEESADIRLSTTIGGDLILQNSFFGYIYAPYMTFKAYGNNAGGGMVRLMGGLTVSDYIIDDSMSMTACWPERMPTELMSDECRQDQLDAIVSKSWKISFGGY